MMTEADAKNRWLMQELHREREMRQKAEGELMALKVDLMKEQLAQDQTVLDEPLDVERAADAIMACMDDQTVPLHLRAIQ